MQKNYYKKLLIIPLVFLLSCCLIFLFVYKNIGSNNKISEQYLTGWQEEASRRDGAQSLNESIKTIEKERISLETHFVQSSNVVPFLDTIEKLASQVQAQAEIVSVDIPKDDTSLVVDMKVTGTFVSIYKALALLENSPYELEFMSVNIQKSTTENTSATDKNLKQGPWSADLKIKLLSFIQ